MMRHGIILGAVLALAVSRVHSQQEPVFRGRSDAVLVSVSVREGNRLVGGLSTGDFELFDNGVRQQLTSASAEAVPVDVTFVLDTSGSLQGETFATLKADIQGMADLLNVGDRLRLLTFSATVVDVLGLQPAPVSLPLEVVTPRGGTSLYNALAAALMVPPAGDRAQLVFAVTDGVDTGSFVEPERLRSLAAYSGAALYVALVRPLERWTADSLQAKLREDSFDNPVFSPAGNQARVSNMAVAPEQTLGPIVAAGGGVLFTGSRGESLPRIFRRVLQDFRRRYILSYKPTGVTIAGWHEIAVKVVGRPKLVVQARKGYEGS